MDCLAIAIEVLVELKKLYDSKELQQLLDEQVYEDLISIFLRFLGNMVHINTDG